MKHEFQKLKFFEKYTLKDFENFSIVLEFKELEYHGKLDFTKLEYLKNVRSLYIYETMVDCDIICKNLLFGYFHLVITKENDQTHILLFPNLLSQAMNQSNIAR